MLEPLDRAVVQIHVRHLQIRRSGDLAFVAPHGEAMVLRGDLDRSIGDPPHRVIAAPVAVEQLEGGSSESPGDELVAEADAEDGNAFSREKADRVERVPDRVGVAGTIRDKQTVGGSPKRSRSAWSSRGAPSPGTLDQPASATSWDLTPKS